MKTVILITETSNACVYGIGTYVNQLKQALKEIADIRLFEVIIETGKQGGYSFRRFSLDSPQGNLLFCR